MGTTSCHWVASPSRLLWLVLRLLDPDELQPWRPDLVWHTGGRDRATERHLVTLFLAFRSLNTHLVFPLWTRGLSAPFTFDVDQNLSLPKAVFFKYLIWKDIIYTISLRWNLHRPFSSATRVNFDLEECVYVCRRPFYHFFETSPQLL